MAIREASALGGQAERDQNATGGLLPEGTTIDGRYTILGVLGRGGMATVYRARDRRLDRPVALKVLDAAGVDAEATAAREDRLTAALAHPNIVTVHDSGTTPAGQPFLVLELLAGVPAARLAPLPPIRALTIAEQIAAALDHAHARGIVHCDVKPQNIVVDHAGQATLTDFGVASPETTPTGEMVYGSPAYLAPERLRGAAASPAVDLYALGATLYFLLTARAPYDDIGDVAARVLAAPPTPLETIAPQLPAQVVALVDRALATDPAARFPDAAAMRHAIAATRDACARPWARFGQFDAALRDGGGRLRATASGIGQRILQPHTARLGLVTFLAIMLLVAVVLPRPRDAEVLSSISEASSQPVGEVGSVRARESNGAGPTAQVAAVRAAPSAAAAAPAIPAPIRVEAAISDPTPRRSARLTITGRLLRGDTGIAGVPMRTRWHFRSGVATCDQRNGTDDQGRASCAFTMSGASAGREVVVDVLFEYEGQTYQTQVRFTPQ